MLFNSIQYAIFFAVVFTLHWLLPQRARRPFLLLASLYFYASAIPQYLLLIVALIAFNYGAGLALGWLHGHGAVWLRRAALTLTIVGNLGTLASFKYSQLALSTLQAVVRQVPLLGHLPLLAPLSGDPLLLGILLPLGISFFTFEFIHYAVEVARGLPPMRSLVDFALFAAFFPTQIAGPIKRFPDWVKQLAHPRPLRAVDLDGSVWLILRGLLKKVLVADTLAPVVASAFATPHTLGPGAAIFAVLAFATQIYCDFSGYTDIGRGCAQLLGYAVPENFARPYQAKNPSEFWHRWHISLSSWLRDYLYIPLGGSRVGRVRVYLNLLLTMALGGLWHGASWHFLVWGIYQGLLLCADRLWGKTVGATALYRRLISFPLLDFLRRPITLILVCLGWLLFRANSVGDAIAMLGSMFAFSRPLLAGWTAGRSSPAGFLLVSAAAIVVGGWIWSLCAEPVGRWARGRSLQVNPIWLSLSHQLLLRPALYTAIVVALVAWPTHPAVRFIYFQF